MSDYTDRILTRLEALISDAPRFLLNRSLDDQPAQAVCIGWMASAANLIEIIVPDPDSGYRQLVKDRQDQAARNPWQSHTFAAQIVEALRQLQRDAKAGLLGGIESRVSGETFDDLLDHAEQYLKEKRHEPAGVLGGVVFEDTVRRLCDKHGLEHRGRELDSALNALKSKNVITKLEQKEGVAAAELRAKATHADWKAFDGAQAKAVIDFTRRLIREKLVR